MERNAKTATKYVQNASAHRQASAIVALMSITCQVARARSAIIHALHAMKRETLIARHARSDIT